MRKEDSPGLPQLVQDDNDPVRKTFREAPSFDRAWLTASHRLTTVQRIGFFLISGLMLLAGATFAGAAIVEFKGEGIYAISGLLPLGISVIAFYLGVCGCGDSSKTFSFDMQLIIPSRGRWIEWR
jgi:hypothetical protein